MARVFRALVWSVLVGMKVAGGQAPQAMQRRRMLDYLGALLERAPIYVYPLLLLLIERVLREAYHVDAQAFIGPTLAGTGIGLILPLTSHTSNKAMAKLSRRTQMLLHGQSLRVESLGLRVFKSVCWILTLAVTGLWL